MCAIILCTLCFFLFLTNLDMTSELWLKRRFSNLPANLKPEITELLKNMSGLQAANGINPQIMLQLPSSYDLLPHLLNNSNSLRLAYLLSKGRMGVSLVLGIPTVYRGGGNYLMATLKNLIEAMTKEEANDCVIVVFIGETDLQYVLQIAMEVELGFPTQVNSGLIEIVAPSSGYYPNFNKVRITLGDSLEKVKWRSKQNLDYAFLMSYAQSKGKYYVQLEDDILAQPHFVTQMKEFAVNIAAVKESWFMLDFCELGFIGKMFKTTELPWVIQFFQMFYNDKPVDWLIEHLMNTRVCKWEKRTENYCKKEKAEIWFHYHPSLFQHIGTYSSFEGKIQKLKDKEFGKKGLFYAHYNPSAEVFSNISCYKEYSLERAYLGEIYFWGISPQSGEQALFIFDKPINISRVFFRSGNTEHSSDIFYNTTVEVLPVSQHPHTGVNVTADGYIIVGKFNKSGIAESELNEDIGEVSTLRLYVHTTSTSWVILSEIFIQTRGTA